MKKIKCFSLLLSLLMLLSCIVPAAATEVTTQDNTIAVVPQTLPQEEELTFGTVCIKNGCRTINGMYMLLYQGEAAFKIWTGKDMPVEAIREEFFQK